MKKFISILMISVIIGTLLASMTVLAQPIIAEPAVAVPAANLPADALIKDWYVSTDIVSTPATADEPTGNEPLPGMDNWMYRKDWAVASETCLLMGDRQSVNSAGIKNFIITKAPDFLTGSHLLQASNTAKNAQTDMMKFTAVKDIRVYVGIDFRWDVEGSAESPSWIAEDKKWTFTNEYLADSQLLGSATDFFTGESVTDTPVRYYFYYQDLKAGDVINIGWTGGTNNNCNNIVFVKDITPAAPAIIPDPVIPDAIIPAPVVPDAIIPDPVVPDATVTAPVAPSDTNVTTAPKTSDMTFIFIGAILAASVGFIIIRRKISVK